jgi:Ca-activated chloride channel homolog
MNSDDESRRLDSDGLRYAFAILRAGAVTLLLGGLLGASPALTAIHDPIQPASRQMIHSEVDLVVLPVTVTDRHGEFVSSLQERNFRVYENGQPQKIQLFAHEDVPVTVGLVVDCSSSMLPNRSEVLSAAKEFLLSSNPQDQIFVVNFNGRASLGLPQTVSFTSDAAELEEAVENGPTSGETALYDAIALALQHLALGTKNKKALLVISDGGDNASHDNFRSVLAAAQRANTIVYSIGIVSDSEAEVNPGLLRRLATNTGGRPYFPQSAAALPQICRQIARDLREQYTIGYEPSNTAHDGGYRAIRVTLTGTQKKLTLRTRAGYYAPGNASERAMARAVQ